MPKPAACSRPFVAIVPPSALANALHARCAALLEPPMPLQPVLIAITAGDPQCLWAVSHYSLPESLTGPPATHSTVRTGPLPDDRRGSVSYQEPFATSPDPTGARSTQG